MPLIAVWPLMAIEWPLINSMANNRYERQFNAHQWPWLDPWETRPGSSVYYPRQFMDHHMFNLWISYGSCMDKPLDP